MMKHQNLLALLLTMFSVISVSCSNDDEDEDLMGKWYRVSDFDGLARGEATSFTIGNKGYLTGGYDARKHLNDLWEYDMELDFWTQKTTTMISGNIIRAQMPGVQKRIIRVAREMMP